jgi:hypothetical protein
MSVTSSGVTKGDEVTYIGHYLSFVAVRRENDLFDLGDLALPLLLKQARNSWSSRTSLTFLRSSMAYRCASNALHCSSGISSKVTMMTFFGSISEDMYEEDKFC